MIIDFSASFAFGRLQKKPFADFFSEAENAPLPSTFQAEAARGVF